MNHSYQFLQQQAHEIHNQASPQIMVGMAPDELTCSSPSRMLRRNSKSSLERSSVWCPLPVCDPSDTGRGRAPSDSLEESFFCALCFMSWILSWNLLCLGICFEAEPSALLLLERILQGLEKEKTICNSYQTQNFISTYYALTLRSCNIYHGPQVDLSNMYKREGYQQIHKSRSYLHFSF